MAKIYYFDISMFVFVPKNTLLFSIHNGYTESACPIAQSTRGGVLDGYPHIYVLYTRFSRYLKQINNEMLRFFSGTSLNSVLSQTQPPAQARVGPIFLNIRQYVSIQGWA